VTNYMVVFGLIFCRDKRVCLNSFLRFLPVGFFFNLVQKEIYEKMLVRYEVFENQLFLAPRIFQGGIQPRFVLE